MTVFERLHPVHASSLSVFHAQHLGGQLTALGPETIHSFYDSALRLDRTIGWGAFENNALVGFILGSHGEGSLMAKVIAQHPLRWMILSVQNALSRPASFMQAVAGALQHLPSPPAGDMAEVHFIAVRADQRGHGVGQNLMDRFRTDLAARQLKGFTLSVSPVNAPAVRFYERQGGQAAGDYQAGGELMRRFIFKGKA